MTSPRPLLYRQDGFTAIPRMLLDRALCADMSKRELHLWLLVARLTYGAQGRKWVALRPADLSAVGIGANHARAVLERMLNQGLLLQNGDRQEYCLPTVLQDAPLPQRQERLGRLVARQIGFPATLPLGTPRNGKVTGDAYPETGTYLFPKGEERSSPKGNASTVPSWRFSRSQRRFVKKEEAAIDKVKTKKNKGIYDTREEV